MNTKISIDLTDEQLRKIGYFNPWVDAAVSLPPHSCRSIEACDIYGNIRIDEFSPLSGLKPDVAFWRFIPEPPLAELLLNKRQTKLEL